MSKILYLQKKDDEILFEVNHETQKRINCITLKRKDSFFIIKCMKRIEFLLNSNINKISLINLKYLQTEYKPSMSLYKFFRRLIKFTGAEENTILYSIYLIERLNDKYHLLNENNIFLLVYISLIISLKYNEDEKLSCKYLAECIGLNLKELRNMEYEFCCINKFNFYIKGKVLRDYKTKFFI